MSTTDFCTLLGPNLISWLAKSQPTVSKSSTKAEYRALGATSEEISWISLLLRDLGISQPHATLLRYDNLSAVYLSANLALHKRSKHFDIYYHYIRKQIALDLIETKHIPASQQTIDIFTKPLPRKAFVELRCNLVLINPHPSLRGNVGENTKMGHDVQAQKTYHPKKIQLLSKRSSCLKYRGIKAEYTEKVETRKSNQFYPLQAIEAV